MALFAEPNVKSSLALEITLAKMQATAFGFYLTGSRVFSPRAYRKPESDTRDYDFFCQDCGMLQKWLSENGFRKLSKEETHYTDFNTIQVWRYSEGVGIDVQLVENLQRKMLTQAFLLTFPLDWSGISKQARRTMWEAAMKAF